MGLVSPLPPRPVPAGHLSGNGPPREASTSERLTEPSAWLRVTRAQASVGTARWMSARRSSRMAGRRKRAGHAGVRSTTQRCRPRRWPLSMPPARVPRHDPARPARLAAAPMIVGIGPGRDEAERRAAGIDDEVALRPQLAPLGRVRARRRAPFLAGLRAPSSAARRQSGYPAPSSRSDKGAMRRCPDPCGLPVAQAPPARQARAAAHLLRRVLPQQPGARHEQDAGQRRPVRDRRSPALPGGARQAAEAARSPPRDRRGQGLSPCPGKAPNAVSLGAL